VKRALLVVAAAVLFLQTLAVPVLAKAEGGAGTTSCGGNTICKP
jgi:hypothetical protein